ncbi:glutamine--tRNA ligase/YqeY domain fusion protein [Caldilinea aerophila]|uniref:Glutamine--tRNA ligase n=1 Tax=Caldilinea aerophila (strain DSM 14535 / JCM 11387 / NBRC 104270 / STL-6-O1) TaxID=926550 RepID=I0I3E1_CALAS|nr:glutamine--tRNA ligase/YqeY domain fusion protein [Caldilinea aerophila]BAL99778.1 glutaminyl-tRNA synthetase [Caldilinea aerophila DSM 14535 = NBRC 104270]
MTESGTQKKLPERREGLDFIREIVLRDVESGRYGGRVVTRFPPEPNGYLHIGHAKSIALNFGIAEEFGGVCHLRFDDTNPETEDMEYVEAIMRDVRWLGYDWGDKLFFASDYFEQLYQYAERLILEGKAYVDSLDEEGIRQYRGTVTEPGRPSPYRDRSVEENLDLFRRMRAGEFPDGAHVLRAKGDLASPNMKMRDPLLYRIRHAKHYRTGNAWCIYPMYDYAHPISDAIEGITHSICTLEFENNRAIYDWLLDNLFEEPRPHQYEFARLNLDYTVMSKRKLLQLVEEGHVAGWDDPRMPTIAGLRRRGYTPEGIRLFCQRIGVDKTNSRVQLEVLEDAIRDDLNARAPRVMAVLRPLKVTLTNFPADCVEWLDADYWPHDIGKEGSRPVPLTREVYIERTDFSLNPPEGWTRLTPGGEVRLRHAYFIRCDEVVTDPASGEVIELRCSYDPDSLGKPATASRKRSTAIQWVSAAHAIPVEVRLYDRLFTVPNPDEVEEGKTFKDYLNPNSIQVIEGALVEPSLAKAEIGSRYQFVRHGYFIVDLDSTDEKLVFNRIVELPDAFAARTAPVAKGRPAREKPEAPAEVVVGSISEERERIRAADPWLAEKYAAFQETLGLTAEQADPLTGSRATVAFFEAALSTGADPRGVANWINNEVLRLLKERSVDELPFGGEALGELVKLVETGVITTAAAKTVYTEMAAHGGSPQEIVRRLGLDQTLDEGELLAVIRQTLDQFPQKVAEYRAGKHSLLGMFTGQVMRATGGKADPRRVQELLRQELEKEHRGIQ